MFPLIACTRLYNPFCLLGGPSVGRSPLAFLPVFGMTAIVQMLELAVLITAPAHTHETSEAVYPALLDASPHLYKVCTSVHWSVRPPIALFRYFKGHAGWLPDRRR